MIQECEVLCPSRTFHGLLDRAEQVVLAPAFCPAFFPHSLVDPSLLNPDSSFVVSNDKSMSAKESHMEDQKATFSEYTKQPLEGPAVPTSTGLSDQQKHMLTRLDELLPTILDIHNTLERKLRFNFGLMSSVLTILIIGNISWFDQSKLDPNERGSFVIFAICLLIVAGCWLWAHWPRERLICPLTPTPDFLSQWWNYSPDEYSNQVFLSYETIWKDDQKIRKQKATATSLSHLAVIVGLLAAFFESAVSLGLINVNS